MTASRRPRIGFLGLGWIGRHRLDAMRQTGAIEVAALVDATAEAGSAAQAIAPEAARLDSMDALLDAGLDGLVIATPSALHAGQAIRALEHGLAVFCQKPLGRNAAETRSVVDAARRSDRLLAVDLSYRFTDAMRRIRALAQAGAFGRVFALDLTFHNAYGPDKPWFYDPALSGGGCLMDLGVHLVDLALWLLDGPDVVSVESSLLAKGATLRDPATEVEDYAVATLRLAGGGIVRIACSWRLHAGREAVIAASIHGTEGGAAMRNHGGSFYDFGAERFRGTSRETIARPPDSWGGRAAEDWARRLAAGARFGTDAEDFVAVATILDRVYAAAAPGGGEPLR